MENYFEEESCNLDKVLDEFEKNEDENVSPRLLDAKWNQILNPPSRLTENSALDNVSKSIIAIEAHLKDRSPSLTPCSNGEIECVASELSTMVTEDTSMAEDRKAQPENICSTNALQCGEESLLADVTLSMSCGKSAAPGECLTPCSTPTRQAMVNSENAVDNEKTFQTLLHVADTNEQPQSDPDCKTVAQISDTIEASVCNTVQRHSSINSNLPHSVCENSTENLNSPPISVPPMSEVCQLSPSKLDVSSTENNNKNLSGPLDGSNMISVLTGGDDSSENRLKASFLPSTDKPVVNVGEHRPLDGDQIALASDGLQSVVSPGLVVENFSDSYVMNGDEETLDRDKRSQVNNEPENSDNVLTNDMESSQCNADGTDALISLQNGCDSYGMQNPTVAHNPKSLPSKEDSVTEEKEIEECKSEYYANVYEQREDDLLEGRGLLVNAGGEVLKNHLHSLCSQGAPAHGQTSKTASSVQPLSVPYGGARPKQPTHLKLQIPKPLSEMLQCDLVPPNAGCSSKNKNDVLNKSSQKDIFVSDVLRDEAGIRSPGFDANGDLLGDYRGPNSPCLAVSPDSPDNDLLAGQYGVSATKPLTTLGEVAPVWVPDSQAPNCMKCEARFTFTKRRHHCRACGKVFCAACCSLKCKLLYMDKKEARVCVICHSVLLNAQAWENMMSASVQSPNPNNPAEYCSTIPPMQQAQASGALSSPPPTVMVPVGVLKHPGTEGSQSREQRRVWFADGILPNGEAADAGKVSTAPAAGNLTVSHDTNKSSPSNSPSSETENTSGFCGSITQVGSAMNLIPEDGLPPILISTGVKGDYAVEERPSQMSVMQQMEDGGPDPLVFVLNANLLAMVKIVNYVNRKCWCFTTKGMHAVGQAELVILLQCLPDEKCLPRDVFCHFVEIYREALAGNMIGNLGHSFVSQSFLGSKEHGGFLYVTPTYQSLQDLVLPAQPYLFGILIQKWETPWAKVFPMRLMLRLGAEYRLYPCPLFSVRFRKPLFGETGHTIINVLADFRNYQYTLPVVQGLVVDMEVRKTSIKIPSNRYNEMMKAMNKSNEHVLAGGTCFNQKADSHLVCVQNDDGNYQTQAISIHNQPRKVTGASFFVFSGALKPSSGFLAKSSIVEDGVMVQITAESMDALRQALREMKDYTITCGKADAEESQEHVYVQWVKDDKNFNKGVSSPIDGKSLESVTSVKISHGSEYKANGKIIRWTEVFFLDTEEQQSGLSDPADHSRLTENVAKAFCLALCPHLKLLKEDGMTRLGLRVTLNSDQVGYQAGSNGQPLPPRYTHDLDSALVPVIHGGTCQINEGPVTMELIFYILENIS
ncbi:zinc finger FYVE domain-containing protein 9 [Hyla sarda]|uniref:zinc finger FYVE domain-containing protein 9 n=1 Tax=Hyla sarda TaxID=327740 RepID=UPI0024C3D290|nr:zinc finger FYVE domain-containing protein 9 [Hyla sarda]XP_056388215.1 zinc finger FYVE domain-containing protein 9 [Hyla sarda]